MATPTTKNNNNNNKAKVQQVQVQKDTQETKGEKPFSFGRIETKLGAIIAEVLADYDRFFPMPQDAYQFKRKLQGEYIPIIEERVKELLVQAEAEEAKTEAA